MKKTIVYYTDNNIDEQLRAAVAKQLVHAAGNIPIVSVSWEPVDLGKNMVVGKLCRSEDTMRRQIVIGVRNTDADVIYLAEHDVLYHRSHFEFKPPRQDTLYYNENRWWLRLSDGKTAWRDRIGAGAYGRSQMVGYAKLIVQHYTTVSCKKKDTFVSRCPSIDIRHEHNFTNPDLFSGRSIVANGVPYWGKSTHIMNGLKHKA